MAYEMFGLCSDLFCSGFVSGRLVGGRLRLWLSPVRKYSARNQKRQSAQQEMDTNTPDLPTSAWAMAQNMHTAC